MELRLALGWSLALACLGPEATVRMARLPSAVPVAGNAPVRMGTWARRKKELTANYFRCQRPLIDDDADMEDGGAVDDFVRLLPLGDRGSLN